MRGMHIQVTELVVSCNRWAKILKDGKDLVSDSDQTLANLFSYPLQSTLASPEGRSVLNDNLSEVVRSFIVCL